MAPPASPRFIYESIIIGRYVKMSAIDPVTGAEASVVGDPRTPKETLMNLAGRKLSKVLAQTDE